MLKLKAIERETIIGRSDDEDAWTIYTCSPPMIRKLSKLSKREGIPIEQVDEYGYQMKLPIKAIHISIRRRKLSEKEMERRKKLGKVLGQSRWQRNKNREE